MLKKSFSFFIRLPEVINTNLHLVYKDRVRYAQIKNEMHKQPLTEDKITALIYLLEVVQLPFLCISEGTFLRQRIICEINICFGPKLKVLFKIMESIFNCLKFKLYSMLD